jgi:hypothetical protein
MLGPHPRKLTGEPAWPLGWHRTHDEATMSGRFPVISLGVCPCVSSNRLPKILSRSQPRRLRAKMPSLFDSEIEPTWRRRITQRAGVVKIRSARAKVAFPAWSFLMRVHHHRRRARNKKFDHPEYSGSCSAGMPRHHLIAAPGISANLSRASAVLEPCSACPRPAQGALAGADDGWAH